jgi:hypothetical protein
MCEGIRTYSGHCWPRARSVNSADEPDYQLVWYRKGAMHDAIVGRQGPRRWGRVRGGNVHVTGPSTRFCLNSLSSTTKRF